MSYSLSSVPMASATEYRYKVTTDNKGNCNVQFFFSHRKFNSKDSFEKPDWKEKVYKYKYIWISSLFIVTIIAAVFCTISFHPLKNVEDIDQPYNFTQRYRTRAEWFTILTDIGCPNLLIHPAKYVIIAHTADSYCTEPMFCENLIKSMQGYHLHKGYCDIGYNFIITGDGYIYEGIGWGKYGAHTYGFNCDSIGIAFMGNFDLRSLPRVMEESYHLLIQNGLELNEISEDYKLFGAYQVALGGSESPGINVIKKMKNWENWSEATRNDRLCT